MLKKIKNSLRYWYWYSKVQDLEDMLSLSFLFSEFDKTKRATLWYMTTKDIDYAMYKAYSIWGIDSLTEDEKKGF